MTSPKLRVLADDVEPRRPHNGEFAVAFVGSARQQDMEWRTKMEGLGIRRVVHFAIGNHNSAGHAVWRCVRKCSVQSGKQRRAAVLAGIRSGANFTFPQLDIHFLQLIAQRRKCLFGIGLAGADLHALRAVNDQRDNVRKSLPRLFDDQRIGQRNHDDGKCQQPRPCAMRAAVLRESEDRQRNGAKSSQLPKWQMRREGDAE